MNAMNRIVFLVDVDNTLLDNDYIQAELKSHLARQYGPACRDRYWAILEDLFTELGYLRHFSRPLPLASDPVAQRRPIPLNASRARA
jgi:hypothetical protein